MPAYSDLPGTIAPDELDSRDEWVPPGQGLLRSLEVRLGSESDALKVLLASLAPLRPFLRGDTWEAIVDELPWGMRGVMHDAEMHLGPIPRVDDAASYVRLAARHLQFPPEQAAYYVAGALGAVKETAGAGLAAAIAAELPPGLAELWASAR